MLAITSLLVAACAEDIDNNNLGKPLISFGVNEPYAAVADSNEPAATRSFNATDAFTPGNNLFSNAVYASDADKQSAANRVQVEPLEGDYPQELCMLVSKEPWPQPSTATRATENTTAVLNASGKQIGIYSSIYSGNADYSTSSSKFEPTTATAWPTTGSSSTAYDIYAWHPTTFTSTGISMSGQTFTYTLPTTSAAMVDLIGTKESHSYSENNDGSISLTFNHLLAPVCFKLAAGLSGTITSIKFSNIVTTGTYTLGATHADDATYGYTWTATTTGAYTASVSGTGGASEVQVDGSHYFMMIPQTVAAGVVVTITITDGASQSNTLTYTVPSGGQVWKAGQVTTYTISTSTITSFTLTYPQWTESGGSGTTYGPVDNYDVTTEDYGYVGLFAVDKANKIVISNAKVKITSAASHVGTCDLTDAANTAVLGNYILSQNYAYYVYYPYKSSLTGIPTNDQTTYSTLAQSAAAQATPADAADTFFANVSAGWTVETDQSATDKSKYKISDLQIAKLSVNFTMQHKMGQISAAISTTTTTVDNVITYDGNSWNGSTWTSSTKTTLSYLPSRSFTGASRTPYINSNTLYYIGKPDDESISLITSATETGTLYYAWSLTNSTSPSNTLTTAGQYKVMTLPAYSGKSFRQKIWNFSYAGSIKTWKAPQAGTYLMECWGASGGSNRGNVTDMGNKVDTNGRMDSGVGGLGGYSTGSKSYGNQQTLYICVGGSGSQAVRRKGGTGDMVVVSGGYNGGGNARTWDNSGDNYMGSGGGATHIATATGVLSSLSSNTAAVQIVAGGGGGSSYYLNKTATRTYYHTGFGGHGGGTSAGSARQPYDASETATTAPGGGQSPPTQNVDKVNWGTFGQGANGSANSFRGSGGGGGWYGGSTSQFGWGAGGGSGHLGTGVTGNTYNGDNVNRPTNPGNNNGYARITFTNS